MSEILETEPHKKPIRDPDREPPKSWGQFRHSVKRRWALPFLFIDWLSEWAAYGLSRLSILELLETCSSFTLLIGVIFYFVEAPERTKTKHYQAWQVINTAQGKGGSGGRIEAMHELNEDHVPLVGVDVSDAFLQGVRLEHAQLRRANFQACDLRGADFQEAHLEQSDLISANCRNAMLVGVDLADADCRDADLNGANLCRANLHGTNLDRTDLRGVNLQEASDWKMASVRLANIHNVQNAPEGFVQWALANGAVDQQDDRIWRDGMDATTKPTTMP